uniref:Uncharacterized protein n=1 Tax=Anguilla anguilla TaxID=7936 RepID=A0A0E9TP23_ANGAN
MNCVGWKCVQVIHGRYIITFKLGSKPTDLFPPLEMDRICTAALDTQGTMGTVS